MIEGERFSNVIEIEWNELKFTMLEFNELNRSTLVTWLFLLKF